MLGLHHVLGSLQVATVGQDLAPRPRLQYRQPHVILHREIHNALHHDDAVINIDVTRLVSLFEDTDDIECSEHARIVGCLLLIQVILPIWRLNTRVTI